MTLSESLGARVGQFVNILRGKTLRQAMKHRAKVRNVHVAAMDKRAENLRALKGMRRYKRIGPQWTRKFKGATVKSGRVKVIIQKGKQRSIASRKGHAKRHRVKTRETGAALKTADQGVLDAKLTRMRAGAGVGAAGVGVGIGTHYGMRKKKESDWRKRYIAMQAAQNRALELQNRPSTIPMRDQY